MNAGRGSPRRGRDPFVYELLHEDDSLPGVGRPQLVLPDWQYLDKAEEPSGFRVAYQTKIGENSYSYELNRYFFDEKLGSFNCSLTVDTKAVLEGQAKASFLEQGKRICQTAEFTK